MQEQQPTSGAAQEGIIMQPARFWCYRCRTCNDVFASNQRLAGHQHKHLFEVTLIEGCFYHPRPKKGWLEGPHRLCGHPRMIYDQSKQDTVLQVPHVSTHAPTPNPLLNKADSFSPNHSQLVSYGVKLNLNAPLPNKPVESINSSMRNTSICGQKELDLELRL
ncbi:hypothetical protein H5410_057417 [Solanum commersonii]|uniref:C2H2-type domain-containing protein n=1 Tax=Solanum commersonii TaxID=4109 RepID=A0A9J5WMV1_SOLCO|nr:hypothetical protein H5410_057417 [Solanum commersonii]